MLSIFAPTTPPPTNNSIVDKNTTNSTAQNQTQTQNQQIATNIADFIMKNLSNINFNSSSSGNTSNASNEANKELLKQINNIISTDVSLGSQVINNLFKDSSSSTTASSILQTSMKNMTTESTTTLVTNILQDSDEKKKNTVVAAVKNEIMESANTNLLSNLFTANNSVGNSLVTSIFGSNSSSTANIISDTLKDQAENKNLVKSIIDNVKTGTNITLVDNIVSSIASEISTNAFTEKKALVEATISTFKAGYFDKENVSTMSDQAITGLSNVFNNYQTFLNTSNNENKAANVSQIMDSKDTLDLMCQSGKFSDAALQGYKSDCVNILGSVKADNFKDQDQVKAFIPLLITASKSNTPNNNDTQETQATNTESTGKLRAAFDEYKSAL